MLIYPAAVVLGGGYWQGRTREPLREDVERTSPRCQRSEGEFCSSGSRAAAAELARGDRLAALGLERLGIHRFGAAREPQASRTSGTCACLCATISLDLFCAAAR